MNTYKLDDDNIEAIALTCAKQLQTPGAVLVVQSRG
jgi:hypothetical protein